ncbi:AraC family transcriptional regulator [Vibrio olivae]|uniref:AraC family ligand binding domain-containing protein n=1 Tax=Vibrio olivae TaxID=1243002 RepID=A0ABV5HSZ2_9VIBR
MHQDNVNYYTTAYDALHLIAADYKQFAFSRHYHLDFHIGLITRGEQSFYSHGQRHRVGQGQIVLMPPDELHDGHAYMDTGYQVRVFAIQPDWLSDLADLKQTGQIIHFNHLILSDPAVFSQLLNLHQQLTVKNLSALAKDCLPFEGLNLVFDRFGSRQRQPLYTLGSISIQRLKEYLLAHLDQPIRLAELASICHLSPTQFQRHFKATMNISPYAWLSRLRLEQGFKLLKSGQNGSEVALAVGFYDQAHFVKAFKSSYGISPSQIQRR